MGGVVRGLFGSRGQPGQVHDVSPVQFARLRDPVQWNLENLLAAGGLPEFQGQMTAQPSGAEQTLMSRAGGIAMQGPGTTALPAQQMLGQTIRGGFLNPQVAQGPQVNPFQGPTGPGASVLEDTMRGQFLPGQEGFNPFLQQTIDMATRPLFEQFQEVTMPRLQQQAAMAGQQTAAGASSPFDMAAARAQSGLAGAVGDAGTQLAGRAFEMERGMQQQAAMQSVQQQLQAAMQEQALQQRAGMQTQALTQQAREAERGRQQQAAFQAPQMQEQLLQSQMQRVMQGLQAQALPRLIEDQGIERGMQQFQQQVQTLMNALGLAGQLGQPQVAQTQGTQGTPGLFGGLVSGFAPAAGMMAAGRLFG